MRFWRGLGETCSTLAPVLELGDVLVMNKCTVHSATGVNSLARERQAWQLRFSLTQNLDITTPVGVTQRTRSISRAN